jgi:hypothetical protein
LPSPGPKESDGLTIGLGVSIPLEFILLIGITAGSNFLQWRWAALAPAAFNTSSGQQP